MTETLVCPAAWTGAHVAAIPAAVPRAPAIGLDGAMPATENLGLWDAWPVQYADGSTAELTGGCSLWMTLAAPRFGDPDARHDHARIHLFERSGTGWRHLGPAMPDGFSPGSREWSGSAVLNPASAIVTLYFTATGRRGEASPTFEQRLFAAEATLAIGAAPRLTNWRALREIVARDPAHYMASDRGGGTVGTIKAFRDPAYFRDPADGAQYLVFAGSQARSRSAFNGVVGIAAAPAGTSADWRLLPPLITADGLNNELERPHLLFREGLYYLFWSTQAHAFDPTGPIGPTGLYGMVSSHLRDGWEPLNGTGLVFANPHEAPSQAYSWLVLSDLSVTSFVDDWGVDRTPGRVRRFGGTFAPFLRLRLDRTMAGLA